MKKTLIISAIITSFVLVSNCYAAKALKKTVAVFDFKNNSGYSSTGANLGKDFSTQLSDALIQSGDFIVLSRKDLDVVMAEQDLAKSGRFAKSNSAKTGKVLPAQILVKGEITEFQQNTSGGGQGLNIKGFSIGSKKSSAHVAVIVQLIDSTTGEILASKRVEGKAKSGGFSFGYSGDFGINTSNFKKTPLGKAVQIAIDNAVVFIAKKMEKIPWKGKVILVKEDGTVFINSGKNTGIKNGDTFNVYSKGESLIDPDTGMELGSDTTKIAEISVFDVQDKFSKARISGTPMDAVSKGNIVLEQK